MANGKNSDATRTYCGNTVRVLRIALCSLIWKLYPHLQKQERHRKQKQARHVWGKYTDFNRLNDHLVPLPNADKGWNKEAIVDAFWKWVCKMIYNDDVNVDKAFSGETAFLVKVGTFNELNGAFFDKNPELKREVFLGKLQECLNKPEVVFKGWIEKAGWHDVLWLYDAPQRDGKPDWGKIRDDQKIRKEYGGEQLDKLINDFDIMYEKQLSSDDVEQENETEATPKRKNVGSGSGANPKKKAKKAAAAAVPKKMTKAQLLAELNALGLGQTLKKNAKRDELVAALNEATAPAAGVSAAAAAAAFMVKKPTPVPEEAQDDEDFDMVNFTGYDDTNTDVFEDIGDLDDLDDSGDSGDSGPAAEDPAEEVRANTPPAADAADADPNDAPADPPAAVDAAAADLVANAPAPGGTIVASILGSAFVTALQALKDGDVVKIQQCLRVLGVPESCDLEEIAFSAVVQHKFGKPDAMPPPPQAVEQPPQHPSPFEMELLGRLLGI